MLKAEQLYVVVLKKGGETFIAVADSDVAVQLILLDISRDEGCLLNFDDVIEAITAIKKQHVYVGQR